MKRGGGKSGNRSNRTGQYKRRQQRAKRTAMESTRWNRDRISSTASQSTSDALESLSEGPSPLVWKLTFVASISGFLFGYDTGYISSVLVSIGTDLGGVPLTIKQREYVSSATSLGALVASLFAGVLADLIGRKYAVMFCDMLFVAGAALQYTTTDVAGMVTGRLIMGLGVGVGSLCAPLYISELSPSKFRGRLVTVNCLAITGGQLAAYTVGAFFSGGSSDSDGGGHGWRNIVLLSLAPCLVQFFSILFLPDTPRYLIMKDRYDDAITVLKRVYPLASDTLIHMNVNELQQLNMLWSKNDSVWHRLSHSCRDLFSVPSNRRSLVIACGLQAIQQFVGFNALMYFSSSIFEMVGFENSTLVSCFIAGTNFATTVVALLIIDRVGRRRILLYSIPLLLLAQVSCALAFANIDVDVHTHVQPSPNGWRFLLLISLILFVCFYSIGLGNVPWQQSELFPQRVRGLGSSLSTATNWFGSMLLSFCFLSLMDSISPSLTFLLFSFNTFLAFIFVYRLYPELSGLQLEEIQALLSDGFNVAKSMQLHKEYQGYQLLDQI